MGISLQDVLGSSLLDSIKGIISQFHMSPEEKADLTAKLDAQKDQFVAAENDYNMKLNDVAGQNIRAEETSGDNYTRRARPSVIWVGLFVIVWNYCLLNLLGHLKWFASAGPWVPWELPSYFWEAWSAISLGYVFNRTAEKIMAMPGDSSIKLPFGIQVGQKTQTPQQ